MADHLLVERVCGVAGIGLQLNRQLPLRVEQPSMTRFEMSAAFAAELHEEADRASRDVTYEQGRVDEVARSR